MYGIFTYIHYKHQPNVGKYTIHGSHGLDKQIPDIDRERRDAHKLVYNGTKENELRAV